MTFRYLLEAAVLFDTQLASRASAELVPQASDPALRPLDGARFSSSNFKLARCKEDENEEEGSSTPAHFAKSMTQRSSLRAEAKK